MGNRQTQNFRRDFLKNATIGGAALGLGHLVPPLSVLNAPTALASLDQLMVESHKDVCIGEGSAVSYPNLRPGIFGGVCRTTDRGMLNQIQ